MTGGQTEFKIIESFTDRNAPTGDGARYVDERGTVWSGSVFSGRAVRSGSYRAELTAEGKIRVR